MMLGIELVDNIINEFSNAPIATTITLLSFLAAIISFVTVKMIKKIWYTPKFVLYRSEKEKCNQYLNKNFPQAMIVLKNYYINTKGQENNPVLLSDKDSGHPFEVIPYFINTAFSCLNQKSYIVLADPGMGKTVFLLRLYKEYTEKRSVHNRKKMVFVPLSNRNSLDIVQKIEDKENTILLLDALDENLDAILELNGFLNSLYLNSSAFFKVVITSRTNFFLDEEREPNLTTNINIDVGDKKETTKKIYLSPFTDEDIQKYINKKYRNSPEQKNAALEIVQNIKVVATKPIVLSWLDELLDEKKDDSRFLCQYYKIIVHNWIKREAPTLVLKSDYSMVDNDYEKQVFEFCVKVAKWIFKNYSPGEISSKEIELIASEKNVDLAEITARSRTLLVRNPNGMYMFSHRSFYEYFTAIGWCYSHEHWMIYADNYVGTDLMAQFIGEIKALAFIAGDVSCNLSDLRYANFEGMDLQKKDFSNVDLSYANFKNSILRGACFRGAKLRGVDFRDADLSTADLSDTNMKNAKVENTNFENADLRNADLKYVNLASTNYLSAVNIEFESRINEVEIGNPILFGNYYVSETIKKNKREPLIWVVEKIEDDRILLASEYRIHSFKIEDTRMRTIDDWLQTDFVQMAFNEKERLRIEPLSSDNGRAFIFLKHYNKDEANLFHNPYLGPGGSDRPAMWIKKQIEI